MGTLNTRDRCQSMTRATIGFSASASPTTRSTLMTNFSNSLPVDPTAPLMPDHSLNPSATSTTESTTATCGTSSPEFLVSAPAPRAHATMTLAIQRPLVQDTERDALQLLSSTTCKADYLVATVFLPNQPTTSSSLAFS